MTYRLWPVELRVRGFEVLMRSLGWVNAVRFVQQYESSKLDYTEERANVLPNWDAEEMLRRMKDLEKRSQRDRASNE